ncbi:hypothetical protein BSUW23_04930 [Bacillus spizizenii str. W23]|uniref:Uncharacterized protein n=1 Tax=Bacillus spizizenii (strain ATCC 23059 / NRRL B-14472 / W23) TaxID=655816 RepID=E0TXT8_BACSH|nr:hypothetical protein BSUW23_04930 [Bacillus spizizenii str. W23]AJW86439.1 endoplasmic reticulum receptor [Bacillus spizizenii]EFG91202.1 hypothetical protein BSU6633_14882 [Bacillus spizizenii ATCC 6633 = JCM 2499]KFI04125.1 endoplasmic reticulum receptor [Bacillus sp. BSC154]QCJ16303.1 endoplasmic reticulum receptor [Bacillus subtilis]
MFIVPLFQNIIEEFFVMQFVLYFDKNKARFIKKKRGRL